MVLVAVNQDIAYLLINLESGEREGEREVGLKDEEDEERKGRKLGN